MAVQLIGLPRRIARLPRNDRGYPIPKFVEYVNDEPDFRIMSASHLQDCVKKKICWVCGERLGVFMSFTIGPMCAINRISAEPPSHLECAEFSARNCPFLTNPKEKRDHKNFPTNSLPPPGVMLDHNPGVTLVWTTKKYDLIRYGQGVLFNIGEPAHLHWYCRGVRATREQVLASIDKGLPFLLEAAKEEGKNAVEALERQRRDAMKLVPA